MKTLKLNVILGLTLSGLLTAGPAEDIAKKHAAASATELEAYLKANPNATDKKEAEEHLLVAYSLTDEVEKSIVIMQSQFKAIPAGAKTNPRELFMATQSLFSLLREAGKKEEAKKLIVEAKQKGQGNPAAEQLNRAFQQMEKMLLTPSKGDTMNLKFTSLQGKPVDVASMKGKVILVDFWATWCQPCIRELPHVIETYNKYHSQGFEVIGVSLDKAEDKEKLLQFLKDKNMPWPQHFDGKGWGNALAKEYGISGIPATYLIGPNGKIVATNLRGDALEKEVAKHIKK